MIWGRGCQNQVSQAVISNYIITSHSKLSDVITYPCLRYLLLATKSSYVNIGWGNGLVLATSHYLSQCWLSSMPTYGITRPRCVEFINCMICHLLHADLNGPYFKYEIFYKRLSLYCASRWSPIIQWMFCIVHNLINMWSIFMLPKFYFKQFSSLKIRINRSHFQPLYHRPDNNSCEIIMATKVYFLFQGYH